MEAGGGGSTYAEIPHRAWAYDGNEEDQAADSTEATGKEPKAGGDTDAAGVIKAAPAGGPCHASMENGWNSERLNTFAFFLAERERIRRGKESGVPPPWTKDRCLQSCSFCNVFEEDDTVSKASWQGLQEADGAMALIVTAVAHVLTGSAGAIAEIGALSPADMLEGRGEERLLEALRKHGFTGAYAIPYMGVGAGKPLAVAAKVREVAAKLSEETLASLRASSNPSDAFIAWLRSFAYIGPLLAYLVACKVSDFDPSLYDKRKHVVACAGAKRGLSWLATDVHCSCSDTISKFHRGCY